MQNKLEDQNVCLCVCLPYNMAGGLMEKEREREREEGPVT